MILFISFIKPLLITINSIWAFNRVNSVIPKLYTVRPKNLTLISKIYCFYRPIRDCFAWWSTRTSDCQSTRTRLPECSWANAEMRCHPICSLYPTRHTATCCRTAKISPCWSLVRIWKNLFAPIFISSKSQISKSDFLRQNYRKFLI